MQCLHVPRHGYLSLPNNNVPFRQQISRFGNGPASPHEAAGVRETNTTSLWVPLPNLNQQPGHHQYGNLPTWQHVQMTSNPPQPRAKKKTPNTTTTRQPPNSACVTGSIQTPTLALNHDIIPHHQKSRHNRYHFCPLSHHSVYARHARAPQTFSRPVDGAAGWWKRTNNNTTTDAVDRPGRKSRPPSHRTESSARRTALVGLASSARQAGRARGCGVAGLSRAVLREGRRLAGAKRKGKGTAATGVEHGVMWRCVLLSFPFLSKMQMLVDSSSSGSSWRPKEKDCWAS